MKGNSPVKAKLNTGAENNSLLLAGEPAGAEIWNSGGKAAAIVLCDHASARVPAALGTLGLPQAELEQHIGSDPGAAWVARHLAVLLGCPAILCRWSRLVVDCNRNPEDPGAMPAESDGTLIPANNAECLTAQEKYRRLQEIFWPYHRAVSQHLDSLQERFPGHPPLVLAIHSFTPRLRQGGAPRPWHVGLLWNQDDRLMRPLMAGLQSLGFCVGDNQPYSGRTLAWTLDTHAGKRALPHIGIELRQDLLGTEAEARCWAGHLAGLLSPLLATGE